MNDEVIMSKTLLGSIIFIATMIVLFCGREKQWWEDCYSSEEAAHLDQLRVDLANMMEDKDSKIEELASQVYDLQDEINNLTTTIENLR